MARIDEYIPFDSGDNRRHNEKRGASLLEPASAENSCRGAVLQVPTCRHCFGRAALDRHAFRYIDRRVAVRALEPPCATTPSMAQAYAAEASINGLPTLFQRPARTAVPVPSQMGWR